MCESARYTENTAPAEFEIPFSELCGGGVSAESERAASRTLNCFAIFAHFGKSMGTRHLCLSAVPAPVSCTSFFQRQPFRLMAMGQSGADARAIPASSSEAGSRPFPPNCDMPYVVPPCIDSICVCAGIEYGMRTIRSQGAKEEPSKPECGFLPPSWVAVEVKTRPASRETLSSSRCRYDPKSFFNWEAMMQSRGCTDDDTSMLPDRPAKRHRNVFWRSAGPAYHPLFFPHQFGNPLHDHLAPASSKPSLFFLANSKICPYIE